MRRLTIKALGVVGALDPYTHKVYLGTVHSTTSKSLALSLPQAPEAASHLQKGSKVAKNSERGKPKVYVCVVHTECNMQI